MGEFIVKKTETGFIFHLKAANKRTIGISQVYVSLANSKIGIESVRTNAGSHVEDQTVEGFETLTHPKYEMYVDKAGEFRFRLRAANGENILASHGYKSKSGCMNGIESVGTNAPDSPIVDESKITITDAEGYENDAEMDFMKDPSAWVDGSKDEDIAIDREGPMVTDKKPASGSVSEPAAESSSGSCGCGAHSDDDEPVMVEETVIIAVEEEPRMPKIVEKPKKKHKRRGIFGFLRRKKR